MVGKWHCNHKGTSSGVYIIVTGYFDLLSQDTVNWGRPAAGWSDLSVCPMSSCLPCQLRQCLSFSAKASNWSFQLCQPALWLLFFGLDSYIPEECCCRTSYKAPEPHLSLAKCRLRTLVLLLWVLNWNTADSYVEKHHINCIFPGDCQFGDVCRHWQESHVWLQGCHWDPWQENELLAKTHISVSDRYPPVLRFGFQALQPGVSALG